MSPATGTAPHVTVLCSTVHPLEVALWCHGHRAGRRGLVRGHRGQELRVAPGWPLGTGPVCVLPLSVSAEGLPPGSATPSHGLAAPGTQMLFSARGAGSLLLTFPTSLLAPWAGAAVGRELLAEQGPPGSPLAIRGSAPSPKCVGGSRRCLTLVHPGCTHPECCDAAARTGWAGRGTEKEAVGSDVDVPRGRCSDIP